MKSFLFLRNSVPVCSLVFGALLLAPAGAAVVNLDFGRTGQGVYSSTGPASDSGTHWNEASYGMDLPTTTPQLTFQNLTASDGTTTTGISVEITSGFYRTYNGGSGNTLEKDYFWTKSGDTGTVTIKGLDGNGTYSIYMVVGSDQAPPNNYPTDFTLGGTTKSASADGVGNGVWENGKDYVVFAGVSPDANGEISFTVEGSRSAGILAGVQIVPEPSVNMMLLGLGAAAMFLRRRGQA